MKNYVKIVQAVQYLGDINVLKEVLSKEDVVTVDKETKEVILFKESNNSGAGYWKLKESDYITKENGLITVYKKEKFEKDFDEVLIENTATVKEIQVNEFVEVKSGKELPSKSKKE